ncbi:hypothetical protein, partial [Achromobacter insolitus]|uniref:hypothetical protein n=1 Tax=Achromobacter insolitus TaxID=217204 RepID=UPI0028AE8929
TTPWFVARYSIQLSYGRSGKEAKLYQKNLAVVFTALFLLLCFYCFVFTALFLLLLLFTALAI